MHTSTHRGLYILFIHLLYSQWKSTKKREYKETKFFPYACEWLLCVHFVYSERLSLLLSQIWCVCVCSKLRVPCRTYVCCIATVFGIESTLCQNKRSECVCVWERKERGRGRRYTESKRRRKNIERRNRRHTRMTFGKRVLQTFIWCSNRILKWNICSLHTANW